MSTIIENDSMSNEKMETEVISMISEVLRVSKDEILPDTQLKSLGLTSLDFVEIVYLLEQKYKIQIPLNLNYKDISINDGTVAGITQFLINQINDVFSAKEGGS